MIGYHKYRGEKPTLKIEELIGYGTALKSSISNESDRAIASYCFVKNLADSPEASVKETILNSLEDAQAANIGYSAFNEMCKNGAYTLKYSSELNEKENSLASFMYEFHRNTKDSLSKSKAFQIIIKNMKDLPDASPGEIILKSFDDFKKMKNEDVGASMLQSGFKALFESEDENEHKIGKQGLGIWEKYQEEKKKEAPLMFSMDKSSKKADYRSSVEASYGLLQNTQK
jgi:hypothetical protein